MIGGGGHATSLLSCNGLATLDLGMGVINDVGACWVCDNPNTPEYHHIIERASGGENGPQVRLCGNCHSGIHKVADAGPTLEVASQEFLGHPNKCLTMVLALAILITTARKSVAGDPNKTAVFSTRFNATTRKQLRELSKVVRLKGGQASIVVLAIAELHKRFYS